GVGREISRLIPLWRLAVRQAGSKSLVEDLERWMRDERGRLSAKNPLAKAMAYMLNRWRAFTRFLDDGRICMSNNAAERAERRVAVGRKDWTFFGSVRRG